MQDPSQGIQRDLQPHVHLLSTYRFPQVPSIHPDKVAEWLLGAPKIARDQAPFYWTYLDRPADGTILLVWQSMSLGSDFPSDGYVWAPAETAFQIEVSNGYILEMYHHKIGYAPGEPFATHTRRRYRLLPSQNPAHTGGNPDPALWIIHYGQSEPSERVPANVIPVDMRMQQTLSIRQHLHSQGQIVQKDFMLHDRANWPHITFPRGPARNPQQMYASNAPPARIPQTMAYPLHHSTAAPPTKRVRTHGSSNQAVTGNASAVLDADDDEDTSRGDLFDHTTPREISMARYKQNHEWMEEILSSPYSINQIMPADLGLGLGGELASLTEGIFDAPFDPEKDVMSYKYVGRLDAGKADEFRKRAHERIDETNKEIEKMKRKHAKRLAKFQKGSLISMAEKELRTAVDNPSDIGPEYWRLEGKIDEEEDEDGKRVSRNPAKVSDIVAQVEASVGRHAEAVRELIRIQDGGYEEAPATQSPPPTTTSALGTPGASQNGSNHSGVLIGDADIEMGNSVAGLLDQFHTGFSSAATPGSNNFPTPQAHLQSGVDTPSNMQSTSPASVPQQSTRQGALAQSTDIQMGEASSSNEHVPSHYGNGTGDWVVIPPGGISPTDSAGQGQSQTQQAPRTTSTFYSAAAPSPAIPSPAANAIATTSSQPSPAPVSMTAGTSAANTPGMPDFHTSPNDFADLGDLDSAGDALAGYGEAMEGGMGGMGDDGDMGDLGLDMDAGMDDSAFGDAFHGVESRGDGGLGDGL